MTDNATANPPDWAPWRGLLGWAPFRIDALGLVTLLGAEQVNASVGRLVRSRFLEYFPLLGAFVISGNAFRNKEAGYNLYNITQGIHTTDMAAWLTRWMHSQDFDNNRSLVRWTVEKRHISFWHHLLSLAPSFCANGMLIAMTVLSYDWYGFANALAMILSIFVRWYLLFSIRKAIDDKVQEAYADYEKSRDRKETFSEAWRRWETSQKKVKAAVNGSDSETKDSVSPPHYLEHGWNGMEPAKILIIMNDAKAVTMMVPRDLLAPPSPFIANLDPPNRAFYGIARWIGWAAFAVQVVTIGMADLVTQIVTVVLLVVPTILYIARMGCDDSRWGKNVKHHLGLQTYFYDDTRKYDWPELKSVCWIGSMLKAEVYEWPWTHEFAKDGEGKFKDYDRTLGRPKASKRQHLYAWLQLSKEERESVDKWDLFPHERGNNTRWIDDYKAMRDRIVQVQLQERRWGINSLVGTVPTPQPAAATPAPAPVAPTEPRMQTHIPALDTKLAKHQAAKSSKDQEVDTADTAQDGTILDTSSPSLSTSPSDFRHGHQHHRPSVAFSSAVEDEHDNIKPLKKSYTEPVGRDRRHSLSAAEPSGSAFWVTNRLAEKRENVSDSDSSNEEDSKRK